jgi:uncharacterized membrane protein YhiD involved in acid resistance
MVFDISTLGDSALRLALALLMGSAIGIERQWQQKMAGLRTTPWWRWARLDSSSSPNS